MTERSKVLLGRFAALLAAVAVLACATPVRKTPAAVVADSGQRKTQELLAYYFTTETAEQSANVSSVERITNSPQFEGNVALSPDGKKLAVGIFDWQKQLGEAGDIWVINLETGAQVRMSGMDTDERNPVWSADGSYIYFETSSFGGRGIGRIHATESSGVMQITSGQGESLPHYSSQNKKLVFATHRGIQGGLVCTVNENGSQYTQMRPGTWPRWSPDGSKIAFVRWVSAQESQIWVMGSNGGSQTQLTGGNIDLEPAWSPDGKHIVFTSSRGEKKDYNIWVMDAAGGGQTQLTTNASGDIQPIFGDTSNTVFFSSNRGGQWDVWKLSTTIQSAK